MNPSIAPRPEVNFILHGPVLSGLLRLGLPTLVVILLQTIVGVAETYFVSRLGTDAIAGAALVFPVLMLMQMMANGGFGGGVASAISRAIGAGRHADAQALFFHAIVLAVGLGLTFMVLALLGGPYLYRMLGANAGALAAANAYSNAIFFGSIPLWMSALLAAASRGAGQVRAPAIISLVAAIVLVPVSPILIFGFGPIPAFGMSGGGAAVAIYMAVSALALIIYLSSRRSTVRLAVAPLRLRLFKDILGVGALSALGTIQTNLTVALIMGAVGIFGTDAIAGFGIASRIDYLLIPILFGLGTGVLTMVGTAVGAGDVARAKRVAWTGAGPGRRRHRRDRRARRDLSGGVDRIVQPRSGCSRDRHALPAARRTVLCVLRNWIDALFRKPGRGPGDVAIPRGNGALRCRRRGRMGGGGALRNQPGPTLCDRRRIVPALRIDLHDHPQPARMGHRSAGTTTRSASSDRGGSQSCRVTGAIAARRRRAGEECCCGRRVTPSTSAAQIREIGVARLDAVIDFRCAGIAPRDQDIERHADAQV